MKRRVSALLLCAGSLCSPIASAGADELDAASADLAPDATLQRLFTFTNDRDANVDELSIALASPNVPTGMAMSYAAVDTAEPEAATVFPFRDIASDDGVTLIEGQGRRVVILQGEFDADALEGRFHLSYLTNGLTMTYSTCDFLLKKRGNDFVVKNAYTNATVTNVKIVTWSLGLTTLEGICPRS